MSAEGNQFENANGNGSVQGEGELAQQMNQNASVPPVQNNVAENAGENAGNNASPENAGNNAGENAGNNAGNNAAPENNAGNNAAPENNAANNAANNSANNAANNTANTTVQPNVAVAAPTSSYVMSAKAKDLQARRKALFEEMKKEYANVFGDDKKAPKAKMYHAAGLLTIRERDGEEAYRKKLEEYIMNNQGKYLNKTQKSKAPKTAKANNTAKAANTAKANNTPVAAVAAPAGSASSATKVIRSIETMANNMKSMLDTMVSTTKTLVKSGNSKMDAVAEKVVRFANNAAPAPATKKARKTRSNKGSTHKKRAASE